MPFESVIAPVYDGTMTSVVYEGSPFTVPTPNNIIRTDQDWGVHIEWTMSGVALLFLENFNPDAVFRLLTYLERIGPGAGAVLPNPAMEVPITAGTLAGNTRTYTADLQFPAGSVPVGNYHLTSVVQLYHDAAPAGTPVPIGGFIELPMVMFFNP